MSTAPRRSLVPLYEFEHVEGNCYQARLPPQFPLGDTMRDKLGSTLDFMEDGISLGPPHSPKKQISLHGSGRFRHWGRTLHISTSDNTSPLANNRKYHAYIKADEAGCNVGKRAALEAIKSLPNEHSSEQAFVAIETAAKALHPTAFIGGNHKLCWEDRWFVDNYNRLRRSPRAFERKYTVYQLVKSLAWVSGDLAEAGVFDGATSYFMAKASQESGVQRALHLFDSFEGLSEPAAIDGKHWRQGALAVDEAVALSTLAEFPGVRPYKGWIPSRFDEVADCTFAFVHIDVDLYAPTALSLAFFYPRLAAGGILVCDDYGSTLCPGATAAMDQFASRVPERIIHLPTGQGLIIKC